MASTIHRVPGRPERCPECGSEKIADIIYGYFPSFEEPARRPGERRTILGGCCVTNDDPAWECTSCHARFHPPRGSWPAPPTAD
ncbi:MAG: hypothetical protein D6702_00940 [Planctomycetota bacterium]|nr:MAG: hypothetical protein D6702_00940 [Planctomycetota bacterium]